MPQMSRKILIAGGAGLIGSHLVDKLLHASYDAVIAARFCGEPGSVQVENVNPTPGLGGPPWSGAHKLRRNRRFDPEAQEHIAVAEALDSLYGRINNLNA